MEPAIVTFKSSFTGEEIDEAIKIVRSNVEKGDNITPIYFDENGVATPIVKAELPEEDNEALITSNGAYLGLLPKYNKADIDTNPELGDSDLIISSQRAVKTYIDSKLDNKQDKLEAGEGIILEGSVVSVDFEKVIVKEDLETKVDQFPEFKIGHNVEVLQSMKDEKEGTSTVGIDTFVINGEEKELPYSYTKSGKKIAEVEYRPLVEELYNKLGYTIYYTISESDYTLATAKPSDIVDFNVEGPITWEQRADLIIEQRGTAVEGEEVTFPKAFQDNSSFVVTLPYQEKTATGFIPASTGDWIASGKIAI